MTVLLYKDGAWHVAHDEDCNLTHSVKLMPAIDELVKRTGVELKDLDFFGCVVGAGSFTGIRIGVATVKGFCLAYQKPALSITSFDLMAYTEKGVRDGKFVALIDALHGYYYAMAYENKTVTLVPSYISESEVKKFLDNGYTAYGVEDLPLPYPYEKVSAVEGLKNATRNKQGQYGSLEPLYIRKSQAEIEREQRQ